MSQTLGLIIGAAGLVINGIGTTIAVAEYIRRRRGKHRR